MNHDQENHTLRISIEEEMKASYLDYAMSVIVARALPDIRDGLKPVHRRVLYAMYDLNNIKSKPYKKSARVVGDVIGKYHPHGDTAVYETIVRMAQDFSLRYPLIDGQGNFGSIDGDAPAAMRYTEIRMDQITEEFLTDLECDTVDFVPNYDGSLKEPRVLPSQIPNLLINGSTGIAVGMATSIPPHNLTEVVDATLALIANPELKIEDLFAYVKGPDFPTAGYLYGGQSIRDAYSTGRGSVVLRAKAEIEIWGEDRERIIVTEIPYQVNKAKLIEKIADLVKSKKIEGISDLRDESDRTGMRMVIEVKKSQNAQIILNQLYKFTQLQDNYSINLLAIYRGQPKVLNLKEILWAFIEHRKDVILRRTLFKLKKAEARIHLLEGLKKAIEHLDAIIACIKQSSSPQMAQNQLMLEFNFTQLQAVAILEMRLQKLTGLERDKILEEYQAILKAIASFQALLKDEALLYQTIQTELHEIKRKYADERKTKIIYSNNLDFEDEDLISEEETLVSITRAGYIKRSDLSFFKSQHRGGRGVQAVSPGEQDLVTAIYRCNTLDQLLCITDQGKLYSIRVYKIPEVNRYSKGKAVVNLLSLKGSEKIKAILPVRHFPENTYICIVTKKGIIKKMPLSEFENVRSSGICAVSITQEDELVAAKLTHGNNDIFLCTQQGMSIRFSESDIRSMGRTARGVHGMDLGENDQVVAMEVLQPDTASESFEVLTITEDGYGKRTSLKDYRSQSRGGVGVISIKARNGYVLGSRQVLPENDVVLITNKGKMIRIRVNEISTQGRNTQGVILMSLTAGEKIVSFECLTAEEVLEAKEEVSSSPEE
jgi:DNA gyrase subunit A